MSLNKQYTYTRHELMSFFQEVFDKKLIRQNLQSDAIPEDWEIEGYMDGPLTFVSMRHPSGVVFTGWSKFNPNDNQYTERGGLFKAFQKAVDKYVDALAYKNTWGVSVLDQDQNITKVIQESVEDEIGSNQSSGIDR